MAGLRKAGFPVPTVYLLCEDPKVAGTTFYVMDFVEGRIFKTPGMVDRATKKRGGITLPGFKAADVVVEGNPALKANPVSRFATYSAMNQALAQLHAVDVEAFGLDRINTSSSSSSSSETKTPSSSSSTAELSLLPASAQAEYVRTHRHKSYAARQTARWAKQFRASIVDGENTDLVERLIQGLQDKMPKYVL